MGYYELWHHAVTLCRKHRIKALGHFTVRIRIEDIVAVESIAARTDTLGTARERKWPGRERRDRIAGVRC